MKPCPRCRRTTCYLRAVTEFARSKGWPPDLWRFVHAIQNECELVASALREVERSVRV